MATLIERARKDSIITSREQSFQSFSHSVINFYENIICKIEGTINYQSIREKYVAVFRKPLSRTRVRIKFIEPLESIGWLSHDPDPVDGRKKVFEKCRIENENCETTDVYGRSYFKDIFPENKLKEYLEGLEKMRNKNGKNNTRVNSNSILKEKNNYYWFYAKKVPYFLEDNNETNKKIKNENPMKNGSSINDHNLSEKKENCKVEEKELIDHYDEETVLLQIPQEDFFSVLCRENQRTGNRNQCLSWRGSSE